VNTDIAILNEGFLFISPENGEIALSRRGDLGVNVENQLINGAGDLVLSDGLAPIVMPEFVDFSVTDIGEVLVQQPGALDGDFTSVGFIGSTTSELDQLVKSLDGNIRKSDGTVPNPDQTAQFGQGYLESSNVSAIEELINNIDMQRQFEINIKLIKKASELDSAGSKLLSLPT
jgi:flagellar basal-body rod protein FlgF